MRSESGRIARTARVLQTVGRVVPAGNGSRGFDHRYVVQVRVYSLRSGVLVHCW